MSSDQASPEQGSEPAPAPRRTRDGRVLLGPSVRARYLPGALIGLPLVSAVLSPLGAIAIEQIVHQRFAAGADGPLLRLLTHTGFQLLAGFLLLWLVLGLWALIPLLLTRSVVLLDAEQGLLQRRRGLRTLSRRLPVGDIVWAVGGPERGDQARIGHRPGGMAGPDAEQITEWIVPDIGWDGPAYDGLRVLQERAGLEVSPPRKSLRAEARRLRRAGAHREAAERAGMAWRPEYEHDPDAFLLEFDRVRRVLAGREERRPGDPVRARRRGKPHA